MNPRSRMDKAQTRMRSLEIENARLTRENEANKKKVALLLDQLITLHDALKEADLEVIYHVKD